MKKKFIILFMLCAIGLSAHTRSKPMFVSVKEAELKTGTGFFARSCGTVKYADKVLVVEENGKWAKVSLYSNKSVSGWILRNSLTKKKLITSKQGETSANTKELALAGKGLTEGSGSEFKTDGRKNYESVAIIESNKTSKKELQVFIVDGKLKDGE